MVYYQDSNSASIKILLSRYGLEVKCIGSDTDIPHSYWGTPEAGRKNEKLYIRGDTPIHSVLHEACHYVCMSAAQRTCDQIDAKGSAIEENATCYLQILLADHIDGYSRAQLMADMDEWGYSFRLGSAYAWFTKDAEEVEQWLQSQNIINQDGEVSWQLKDEDQAQVLQFID